MLEYVLIAILGLAWVMEKVSSVLMQRAAARERKELYDRLQAGTLPDYAAHRRHVEAEVMKSPPVAEDFRSVEDLTRLEDDIPEYALVEAQSRFNSLMG